MRSLSLVFSTTVVQYTCYFVVVQVLLFCACPVQIGVEVLHVAPRNRFSRCSFYEGYLERLVLREGYGTPPCRCMVRRLGRNDSSPTPKIWTFNYELSADVCVSHDVSHSDHRPVNRGRCHRCPTGEARITEGFRLKAKHVVRAGSCRSRLWLSMQNDDHSGA